MIFKRVDKAGVVADADPNTTPPAGTRVLAVGAYCDPQDREPTAALAIRTRVMNGGAVVAAGTVSFQPWVKDGAAGPWVKAGAAVATLANDTLQSCPVPAGRGSEVFLQVTAVAGAGATDVQMAFCESK